MPEGRAVAVVATVGCSAPCPDLSPPPPPGWQADPQLRLFDLGGERT